MIVWLDIETTGLNPDADIMLELGMVITEDDLTVVAQAAWPIYAPLGMRADVDPVVRDMHDKSGLWDECSTIGYALADAEEAAINFLLDLGIEPGKVQLAGNTIGFDRSFLRVEMPRLLQFFHYRSIDMTSLNELARRWAPALYESRPRPDSNSQHRALADLHVSIDLAAHYKPMFETLQAVEVLGADPPYQFGSRVTRGDAA